VFGRPVAMVDGNVLRVLGRQLGLLGDVKTDKAVIDLLWGAADALVKQVAKNPGGDDLTSASDRPGRWGQALMELGSTVCAPKPNCAACPIKATCRAFSEGLAINQKAGKNVQEILPIEEACTLCQPLEAVEGEEGGGAENPKAAKRGTVKRSRTSKLASSSAYFKDKDNDINKAVDHARRFPLKGKKKKIREEETVVCAIRRPDGKYLLRRRPDKGLLAGLWELPSHDLSTATKSLEQGRKSAALEFASETVGHGGSEGRRKRKNSPRIKHLGELGMVPWVFSHLKLAMHVHGFLLDGTECAATDERDISADKQWRWADADDIDDASMGTGMHKCWLLVKEATP